MNYTRLKNNRMLTSQPMAQISGTPLRFLNATNPPIKRRRKRVLHQPKTLSSFSRTEGLGAEFPNEYLVKDLERVDPFARPPLKKPIIEDVNWARMRPRSFDETYDHVPTGDIGVDYFDDVSYLGGEKRVGMFAPPRR